MLRIAECIEKDDLQAIHSIQGVGYLLDGVPTLNCESPRISDLDSLPFPARHLLPMNKYYEASNAAVTARTLTTLGKKWAPVNTSRGCPNNCVFCCKPFGRKWIPRSPENIVKEIEQLIHQYGVTFINFEEDNLTLNRKRMFRLCELIIEHKLSR